MNARLDSLGRPTYWAPPEDRFFRRYHEVPSPDGFDLPCWQWDHVDHHGYGRFRADGIQRPAHHWAYEHHIGPIPEGLVLDHLCRNRACVNPYHLDPVPFGENVRRGIGSQLAAEKAAARTHCKRGHEFSPENTYMHREHRHCRACRRIHQADSEARKAAS